jgi:hypothetical protein
VRVRLYIYTVNLAEKISKKTFKHLKRAARIYQPRELREAIRSMLIGRKQHGDGGRANIHARGTACDPTHSRKVSMRGDQNRRQTVFVPTVVSSPFSQLLGSLSFNGFFECF